MILIPSVKFSINVTWKCHMSVKILVTFYVEHVTYQNQECLKIEDVSNFDIPIC